ncbi:family 16 glycosylhydrolase [Agaribacterium haliotis]|uniref:family 16 glycosylhydrolase n=1 Tax=Agaribacterium haliotis TaxID=2013869 RepID=UPI000BB54E31|nr:family 16 glycosylhydrolase [Agaribacterium haliotis]
MKVLSYLPLLFFVFLSVSVRAYDAPPPLSDPENSAGWVINEAVSDEFNGDSFDRNVWFNQGENGQWNGQWKGRAPSQYDPANVRVKDGFLYMTARWDTQFKFASGNGGGNSVGAWQYGDVPLTAAALLGKNFFHYGYMEMRSKAAPGPISSSYWTTGKGGETDAFESYGWNPNNRWSAKRFHTSFHDWRKGSKSYGKRIWENDHIFDFNVADDFHTYGFEWDKNYVAIYIDGAMIQCKNRSDLGDAWVANNPQRPWIDMESFDWEVNPNKLKAEHFNGEQGIDFIVDYARVYQRKDGKSGGKCPVRSNLLENGDFEQGLKYWSGPASLIDRDGGKAVVLKKPATLTRTVAVKPNTSYLLLASANSVDTNMRDKWFNSYFGVRARGLKVSGGDGKFDVRYFYNRWHEKSLQFTTARHTTEIELYLSNQPQGGEVQLDDVQLYELTFSTPNVNSH